MNEGAPKRPIRVLVVDDHALFRNSLCAVLAAEPAFEVVAEAGTGAEALARAREAAPDVALLDLELKGESGLKLLRELRRELPELLVLIVTMHNKPNFVRSANAAGAHGYVLKDESASFLVEAVRRVASGERVHSSGLDWSEPLWQKLTERERQVAALLANDYKNVQISALLGVGERAIETYRAHVYTKLEVLSAMGIADYMRKNGIEGPEGN
jgi:DNA-binding NarL/FixJ family response regulator